MKNVVSAILMIIAHREQVMKGGVVGHRSLRFGLSSVDDQLGPVCCDVGESVDESLSAITEQ